MRNMNRVSAVAAMALGLALFSSSARAEDLTGSYKGTGTGKNYSLVSGKPITGHGTFAVTLTQSGSVLTATLNYGVGYTYTLTGFVGNGNFVVSGKSDTTNELVTLTGHVTGMGNKTKVKGIGFFFISDPMSSGDQHVEEYVYSLTKLTVSGTGQNP